MIESSKMESMAGRLSSNLLLSMICPLQQLYSTLLFRWHFYIAQSILMQPAIALKKKLDDSQPVLGMLVMNHFWLELVEIAQAAGLDYMIIDLEHHPRDGELVANACRIGRLAGFAIFLRSRRTDAESIGEVLDLGPCGLLLPMIESAEQLDGVRDGIYLPPRGRRRPGGPGNRWAKQADYEGFKSTVEDHLVVLPQIESQLGLKNVQEIADHEITTALAVGPFDLSSQLGVCGQMDHPKLADALATIRDAAKQAGKPSWMIGDGKKLTQQGYKFLSITEPSYLLENTLRELTAEVRQLANENGQ